MSEHEPPIVLHVGDPRLTRRAEDAVFLSALVAISGLSQLVGRKPTGSVDTLAGTVLAYSWAVTLLVFGGLIILGIAWHSPSTGLLIERIGRRGMTGAALVYAIAAPAVFGWASGFAAALTLGYGLSCYMRQRKITRWVRETIHRQERQP